MSNEIYGYSENPAQQVEAAFERVAQQDMSGLPFSHPTMPVKACDFRIFEDQWVGAIVTPWMLSIAILPGPEQIWDRRIVGARLGLEFPQGNMTFLVGELDGLGQYLSCSLMSPMDRNLTAEQGIQLAKDSVRILLSLPVRDVDAPSNLGRRTLFSGKK